jgi:hypothetical protein
VVQSVYCTAAGEASVGESKTGEWVQSGRAFSAAEIAQIRETVAWLPGLARKELAATVCEHLQWYTLTGTPKIHACGQLLERLQGAGLVQLPALRPVPARRTAVRAQPAVAAWDERPVRGPLSALGPVHLAVVQTAAQAAQWRHAMARCHPLGEHGGFGYRLRYVVMAGERLLGGLLLAGAARALAVRDGWIGWDAPTRRANLVRVLNNTRFLILPHVQVPHLASHVLGQMARRVATDWQQHWGFTPLLLETFVDPRRYRGTCYRAAGWQVLGQTSGRGLPRAGKTYHSHPRLVLVKPLQADWRARLCQAPGSSP